MVLYLAPDLARWNRGQAPGCGRSVGGPDQPDLRRVEPLPGFAPAKSFFLVQMFAA